MTVRELCILEDELQTLWEDIRIAEEACTNYTKVSNDIWSSAQAEELLEACNDAYSKYRYLYTLCDKLGYKVSSPHDRFKLRK